MLILEHRLVIKYELWLFRRRIRVIFVEVRRKLLVLDAGYEFLSWDISVDLLCLPRFHGTQPYYQVLMRGTHVLLRHLLLLLMRDQCGL